MNRSLIIKLLHYKKICSRVDLAKETGLRQATITNIINDLIKCGLVTETGIIEGIKGRRSIGIRLNNVSYKVIGIRLTRKYISIGLFDLEGTSYSMNKEPIEDITDPKKVMSKMKDLINKIVNSINSVEIIGIGLALPGPFLRNEGRIVLMTEFPGWENVRIKEELEESSGLPVYIEHDANCGVLAESWYSLNCNKWSNIVCISVGQGVGAGVIIDGKLYRGSIGIAGEIGHTSINFDGPKCQCGNRGCLELYCSTIALKKAIKGRLSEFPQSVLNKNCSTDSIFKAINDGDELAVKECNKLARYLGLGIINIIYTFNPDIIIIGDEIVKAGPNLLDIVKKTVKEGTLKDIFDNVKLEISSFDNDPVLIGAGALAIDRILSNPSIFFKNK